ncbi:hypothetical protein KI387_036553, partial [Taxus chinensis]
SGSSSYTALFCMATLNNQDADDYENLEGTSDEQDRSLQLHEAANPMVYKLVRVEGDGTMVPATEDDVLEVECFLNDNGSSQPSRDVHNCAFPQIMANTPPNKDFPHRDNSVEEKNIPGPLDPIDTDQTLKAKLKFFNLLLWRVKEEERLRLASGIIGHHSSYLLGKSGLQSIGNRYQQSPNDVSNLQSSDSPDAKVTPFLSFDWVEEGALESKNSKYPSTSMKADVKNESRLLLNQATVVPKPNPDFIRSEISLDNLTIRELHEAFKATFGRETSVKDKQWLKRRIAMALEDKVSGIKKQEEISARLEISVAAECPLPSSLIVQASRSKLTADVLKDIGAQKQPDGKSFSLMPFVDIVGKTEGGLFNDEAQDGEEMGAKRVRKPTRRYIEESSEVESRGNSGMIVHTPGDSDDDYSPPTSRLRSSYSYGFWGTEFVSRHEPLGGSGIEVPFVSRVRRGRPRKNFNALLKYNSSGRAAKLVKKALGVRSIWCDGESVEIRQKAGVVTESNQVQIVHETLENEEPLLLQDATDKPYASQYLNSHLLDEEYVPTVPTAKGGVRRKHHRPWTLRDVMKLVEGVSRCGVGKWADIKKVAFSSSVYRTSVDLKDKWRNLLRASNSQLQTNKE